MRKARCAGLATLRFGCRLWAATQWRGFCVCLYRCRDVTILLAHGESALLSAVGATCPAEPEIMP